ncbi:putative indole-3-acetic acid-amido synthetase GH3.1 [Holothuria leucospilota]|uniref:Indole-3-acetic acid-amido synthetase GH3.1 n=1 Tax=Holothuria leucospilota TaxID=206669 RepID=A0A9Q1H7C3_HOLLE|nr:putative indole-3-acetic acid-amido synthetase GH3.1 [Holothuria leucospilota]
MFNKFRLIAILMYLPLLLAVGLVFFGTMDQAWKSPWGFIHAGIAAVFILVCCTFGTIFLIISTQRTPEHYSIFSALCHFLVKYYQLYIGYKMLRTFRASCENPRKVQENLLTKIIMHNKDTDHGRKFHLCCINSLEDLRKKHTITDYSRYETFVERICKGEKNVLTTENVSRLILTSGTTGKGKRIPQNGYSAYWQMVLQEALQQEMFPDLDPMQSKLKIHCNSQIIKSECGITISSALAIEPRMLKYMVVYSSPANSFMISNLREATYVHLLFALRDRNLGSIFATFSSVFLEAMEYLEANWQKLVNDITKGTLNQELRLAPYIRRSLERHLGSGDHRRAMEVKKNAKKALMDS